MPFKKLKEGLLIGQRLLVLSLSWFSKKVKLIREKESGGGA